MKKLQQLNMAVVLTLTLATGAGASSGIIQTGASSPVPDPPPATEPDTTQKGTIPTPSDQPNSVVPSDAFIEVALSLLRTMFLVF